MKGWGLRSSVCPSKPRETKLFGGISRDFCRDVLGAPEKFEKKKFVLNSRPLQQLVFVAYGRPEAAKC